MDDPHRQFRILIRPSRRLIALLCVAYGGAAACLLSLDLGAGIMGLMLALLVLGAVCDLAVHGRARHRRAPREIVFDAESECRVVGATGVELRGRLRTAILVHPLAVCFTLDLGDRQTLPVLILPDMCRADAFRKLRLWLRAHHGDVRDDATPGHSFTLAGLRNDQRQ